MIIYTRFIRPTMPASNVINVPAYITPVVDKAQRKEKFLPRIVPNKPKEAGARLFICP